MSQPDTLNEMASPNDDQAMPTTSSSHLAALSLAPPSIDQATSIMSLNNDILLMIVDHLDDNFKDIGALRLANRQFRDSTSATLFKTIKLKPTQTCAKLLHSFVTSQDAKAIIPLVQRLEFQAVNHVPVTKIGNESSLAMGEKKTLSDTTYAHKEFEQAVRLLSKVSTVTITKTCPNSDHEEYQRVEHGYLLARQAMILATLLPSSSVHLQLLSGMCAQCRFTSEFLEDPYATPTHALDTMNEVCKTSTLMMPQQITNSLGMLSHFKYIDLDLYNHSSSMSTELQATNERWIKLPALLHSLAPTIERLRIAVYTPSDVHDGFICMRCQRSSSQSVSFKKIFGPVTFQKLQVLEVHNFAASATTLGAFVKTHQSTAVRFSQSRCRRQIYSAEWMKLLADAAGEGLEGLVLQHRRIYEDYPCNRPDDTSMFDSGFVQPSTPRAWSINAAALHAAYEAGMTSNAILHVIGYEQELLPHFLDFKSCSGLSPYQRSYDSSYPLDWDDNVMFPEMFFPFRNVQSFKADCERGTIRANLLEQYCKLWGHCTHKPGENDGAPCTGRDHQFPAQGDNLYVFVINGEAGLYKWEGAFMDNREFRQFDFDLFWKEYADDMWVTPHHYTHWVETSNCKFLKQELESWGDNGVKEAWTHVTDNEECYHSEKLPRINDAFWDKFTFEYDVNDPAFAVPKVDSFGFARDPPPQHDELVDTKASKGTASAGKLKLSWVYGWYAYADEE